MIRMSSLPIAAYCGAAHRLPNSSGRQAAMSTAFHAICHDPETAQPALDLLSADERSDVLSWHKPAPARFSGIFLNYEDAETELEVALDERGGPYDPMADTEGNRRGLAVADPADGFTVGHLDMAWTKSWLDTGAKAAFVADIKRSRWTTEDGPESLQVLAYGLAYAAMRGCAYFACGIWSAMDGEWQWGPMRSMRSMETASILARVLAAAENDTGLYATGQHCRRCWNRFVCPAHAQRGLEGTTLDTTRIDAASAAETLLKLQAASDVAEKGIETMRDWVRQNGPIRSGNREFAQCGKQFRWVKAK